MIQFSWNSNQDWKISQASNNKPKSSPINIMQYQSRVIWCRIRRIARHFGWRQTCIATGTPFKSHSYLTNVNKQLANRDLAQTCDIAFNHLTNRSPCSMMTSSNRNIFRVTGPLCGEFTGHRWIPLTKASEEELCCFLWSAPELTVE